jgi:hypothetical protein
MRVQVRYRCPFCLFSVGYPYCKECKVQLDKSCIVETVIDELIMDFEANKARMINNMIYSGVKKYKRRKKKNEKTSNDAFHRYMMRSSQIK